MNIGACILTAGMSSRMGEPKALLTIHDTTFLENIVRCLRNSGITSITAVSGHHTEEISQLCNCVKIHCVHNPEYMEGQFTSVCKGIRTLKNTDAIILCLVDHPAVAQNVYTALIDKGTEQIKSGIPSVIIPAHNGRGGHPVFIPAVFYDDILSYTGDGGLREVFKQLAVIKHEVGTDSILKDIDTKEDYSTLKILTQNS